MKTSFALCTGIGSLILAGTASGSYTISAETVADSAWGTTIQLYANMGAGERLDAVFGSADNAFYIGTTGSFYHNAFGGNMSTNINPLLLGAFPSLAYDSWVTIGLSDMDGGNVLAQQGVDFSGFANQVFTDNGSWYVTPDDSQGDEIGGRVLIGQFTLEGGGTIGDMDGSSVSLQGKLANGDNWTALDQWVPAPGALALLGLAGLAGRRRRRH